MTNDQIQEIAQTLNANLAPCALVEDMADTLEDMGAKFDRTKFIRLSTTSLMDHLDGQLDYLLRRRNA